MRALAFAVLTVVLSAGCGGRVAGSDPLDDRNAAVDQTTNDRLTVLRARCAEPWKGNFPSSARPDATLVAGRWLRCPGDLGTYPGAFVSTFDAIELTADQTYFRLAVGANGFERKATGLGETGTWRFLKNGDLSFDLPTCEQGYVTTGTGTKCGGLDVVSPMFETSPTRMRFYGAPYWYVKDE